jgi:ferredoxin-type protein NapG
MAHVHKDGKKRPMTPIMRRKFIRTLAMGAGLIGSSLLGFIPVLGHWKKRVRPPGALLEQEFLASCIKCGQCVQVCPVEAIKLTDLDDGFGVGTPFLDTRAQACDFSCDGLQCVLACPTGALAHELNYPHETNMGVARVMRPESCLAANGKGFKGQARGGDFKGLLRYDEIDRWNPILVRDHPYDLELCDLCVRQCPIEIRANQCDAGKPPSGDSNQCPPKRAIRLVEIDSEDGVRRMKPEILDGCVGCGVCEMICPVDESVFAMDIAASRGWAA